MSRKILNASEMGRKGGNRMKELKAGTSYYADINVKGRETILKRDPDFYKNLAKQGYHARQVKLQEMIAKQIGDRSGINALAKLLKGE
jgi:general stress protein YciG